MIAIVTANIGGIDQIYSPAKQTVEYDFLYYSENTLPFPLPNLDNRMKGKYLKTQLHKFLNHDIFIWVDGSVEIIDGTFIKWIMNQLNDCDIIVSKHKDRNNVYDEIDHITDQMKHGKQYLLNRYAGQPFEQEKQFYINEGLPKDFPLYNGFFYARRNESKTNECFDTWWDYTLRYTNFDQTQFAYALWKHKLKVKAIDFSDYFIRHTHKN